jgi:hypothetical protein
MPKRPSKEPASVTIGNLERENRNLKQRCVDLVKDRDSQTIALRHRDEKIAGLEDNNKMWLNGMARHQTSIEEMEKVILRMEGWQDCAREILNPAKVEV